MAEHSRKNFIGVARINRQCRNLITVLQSEMSPGFSRIRGFINAVADREIGTVQAFTASHINYAGIGQSDSDCADRLRGLVIENRIPRASIIV